MSRLENTTKNFVWSTISSLVSSLLGFISRTIFIYTIGSLYLGINSLFTNILAMLSFTELGIGTAINFSLYKPLAQNNIEEIKSLMNLYKKAYRIIAIVVTIIGISILPFLNIFVKGANQVENIHFIYLIFLFNTSYSYLFSYKRTLLSADQKSYLMTNIDMIITLLTLILQILFLCLFKNYYVYLLVNVIIGILQNFYVNNYINKRYPYLLDKNVEPLDKNIVKSIINNIKAMMLHKLGDLCINQTDNIIISTFVNIQIVGVVSNYTLIINIINKFAMNIFNAANASLGNLIATDDRSKSLDIFNGYNFIAFWVFGWTSICFMILLNPFIELWIGSENVITMPILILIIINYYLVGMRIPVANIKAAAGLYTQDKYVPIVQSIVNLFISVIGVQKWGLIGIYIGTVISSLILPCWYRPMVIYKYIFDKSPKEYFLKYIAYFSIILFNVLLTSWVSNAILGTDITWISLVCRGIICLILPNIILYLIFKNTSDFKYVLTLLKMIKQKFLYKSKRSLIYGESKS